MSDWNIGIDHDSEQVVLLKQQLSSKDIQHATVHSQLLKREAEMEEMRATLDETAQKLQFEADRAIHLDKDVNRFTHNLSNEKIQRQNVELALAAANERLREQEQTSMELEGIISRLSSNADGAKSAHSDLVRENMKLASRVQELESNAREMAHTRTPVFRARSPAGPSPHVTVLEEQLRDLKQSAADHDRQLRAATEKASRLQTDLTRLENEKNAMDRRTQRQIQELEAAVEEKTDELQFLVSQQAGDDARAREEELLSRVEEGDAKVQALEMLVQQLQEPQFDSGEKTSRNLERRLREEIQRVADLQARQAELTRGREEALCGLDEARQNVVNLETAVTENANRLRVLTSENALLSSQLQELRSRAAEQAGANTEAMYAETVGRLHASAERLRAERDDLARSLDFVEAELRCANEELRKRQLVSEEAGATITTLQIQVRGLRERSAAILSPAGSSAIFRRRCDRLALTASAFTVVISRLRGRSDDLEGHYATVAAELATTKAELSALSNQLAESTTTRLAETITGDREHEARLAEVEDLEHARDYAQQELARTIAQLASTLDSQKAEELRAASLDSELRALTTANNETMDTLAGMEGQVSDLINALAVVESERDSLKLEVTNMEYAVDEAKQELSDAESRYSELQANQLAAMSASQATKALRKQIEELELRVMRRTEQIGMHQHEIKRLDTNLRLQEERVSELTAELETMSSQKEAMVEDCAAARDARDEALQRLDAMEVELEASEARLSQVQEERSTEVLTLVGLVTQAVGRSRTISSRLGQMSAEHAGEMARASADLFVAEEGRAASLARLATLEAEQSEVLSRSEGANTELRALRSSLKAGDETNRQLSVAMALSQTHSQRQRLALAAARGYRASLEGRIQSLDAELAAKSSAFSALKQDLSMHQTHQDAATTSSQELSLRNEELEREMRTLVGDKADLQRSRDEALVLVARLEQDLTDRLLAFDESSRTCERLQDELRETRTQHVQDTNKLEIQLGEARVELESTQVDMDVLRRELAEKQTDYTQELDDLQSRLDGATDELDRLRKQGSDMAEALAEEQEGHLRELQRTAAQRDLATAAETTLRAQVAGVEEQLAQASLALSDAHGDNAHLRDTLASLELDMHSAEKLHQTQIDDIERLLRSRATELEALRVDLASAQALAHELQVELEERERMHEEALKAVENQLAALRGGPDLEQRLVELKEDYDELEEMLKAKGDEAEESYDRAIALQVAKKSDDAKIAKLTRKVEKMEKKLQAALTAPTPLPVFPQTATPSILQTSVFAPPLPPIPTSPARPIAGSSAIPRPKTPEARPLQRSLFGAVRPDSGSKHRADGPLPTVPSVGKKRPAPDDFEDCGGVPPQAFTADSRPSDANSTPRRRVASHGARSGFTPVRHSATRKSTADPSPRPSATTGVPAVTISDVTNSPRAPAPVRAKTSWLLKAKRAQAPTPTPLSSRPASASANRYQYTGNS